MPEQLTARYLAYGPVASSSREKLCQETPGQEIMQASHRPNNPTVRSRHLSGPRTRCFHGDLLHSAVDGIYQLVLDALNFITELAHTCTTVIAVEEGNTAQSGCTTPCNSSLLQQ